MGVIKSCHCSVAERVGILGVFREKNEGRLWRRSECLDKQNSVCFENECLLSTGQNKTKTGKCGRNPRRTLNRKRQKSQASGCSNIGSLVVLSWMGWMARNLAPLTLESTILFQPAWPPSDLHVVDLAVSAFSKSSNNICLVSIFCPIPDERIKDSSRRNTHLWESGRTTMGHVYSTTHEKEANIRSLVSPCFHLSHLPQATPIPASMERSRALCAARTCSIFNSIRRWSLDNIRFVFCSHI